MKITLFTNSIQPISWLFLFVFTSFFGQTNSDDSLVNSFEAYTKIPREVTYSHLNKSTYIIGETMGFSNYVFDKKSKTPSTVTSNLYCTLSDENNKIVKSKLVLIENGFGSGGFFLDSLFTSGTYTFKAYTNWMRNFDEQNFYIQTIKVIDSQLENAVNTNTIRSSIDAQFLPEGGHLVANTQNTIGVILKDGLGFGLPNVEGLVLDEKNTVINSFSTNDFGLGKFKFKPIDQNPYHVQLQFQNETMDFDIQLAEPKGISMTINDLGSKVALSLNTNQKTLETIKHKTYKLIIHNGQTLKAVHLTFEDQKEIIKFINHEDLHSGLNIFTLFDDKNNPLLERLFFKYDGIQLLSSETPSFQAHKDSLKLNIPIHAIKRKNLHNISISILPKDTKSYNHHHNILSYIHLQPYLNGNIENAQYYFTNIDRKKRYELDLLLLTQGWSSYDWNTIFSSPPEPNYNFEKGIGFTANINKSKIKKIILFPFEKHNFEIIDLRNNQNNFTKNGLYPQDFEKVRIGGIRGNEKLKNSNIYLQFTPSKIPELDKYVKLLPLKQHVIYNSHSFQPLLQTSWSSVEQLDEVVLNYKTSNTKLERLRRTSHGNVDVFDNTKRLRYNDFASYIGSKGFRVNQTGDQLTIINMSAPSSGNRTPLIYLDNMLLSDFSLLFNFNMSIVDYIIIDKAGLGEGIRGSSGVIKIHTNPNVKFDETGNYKPFQEIDIPLTFSKSKRFYAPKYLYYQSQFYKEFGVIDWFPNCTVDADGNITLTIETPKISDIILRIEGTANNGSFISEEKHISINN